MSNIEKQFRRVNINLHFKENSDEVFVRSIENRKLTDKEKEVMMRMFSKIGIKCHFE